MPGVSLSRLVIDGEYTELGTTAHPDYGLPILIKSAGSRDLAWIKFIDGTHTAADARTVDT